jgi:SAM-dependent methyltransferase
MLASPPFSILDTLNAVDDALDHNADLADEILQLGLAAFGLSANPSKGSVMNWQGKAKPSDMSKAHSTIRQFYRDWSHEGFTLEVEPLLKTVLSDLESYLPSSRARAGAGGQLPSLLLPGAGLGRLLFELALRGYHATGNEISYHQLLASNFILNATQHANQYQIYPFSHTFTNVTSRSNQLKRHTVPDVHPGEAFAKRLASALPVGEMNMAAGDFVLSYSTPESKETFDGVVTVFFIDTAPNLIRYIETVRNCLNSDGIWINVGPLLWHFDDRAPGAHSDDGDDDDDNRDTKAAKGSLSHQHSSQPKPDSDFEDKGIAEPGSFELTDEEVTLLVSSMGFEMIKHDLLPAHSGYIQDPHSLLQNRYRCSHWVARKVADNPSSSPPP